MKTLAAAIVWLAAALCVTAALASPSFSGRVVGIADGDTLTVLTHEATHKVRLAEVDAPEKKQAFGERAKQSLAELCFGREALVMQGKADRYGRTVARVRCDGIDASLHQVQQGLAWAYTAYLTDPAISAAEKMARASCLGLWADPEPTAPWLFRKGQK